MSIVQTGKTAALLIGLNYEGSDAALNGCHNDVRAIEQFLCEKLGFDRKRTRVCLDGKTGPNCVGTTARGLTQELYRLACDSWRYSLDLVWIHYSGHGSWVKDRSGDESDGRDECLVPSDYLQQGMITDDQIRTLLKRFRPECRVIFVVDCCHSGTIADLAYSWRPDGVQEIASKERPMAPKVILISGCKDDQTSADAYGIDGSTKYSGALTSLLLQTLQRVLDKSLDNSWFEVLSETRKLLLEKEFTQIPQLCSSFDVHANPQVFSLRERGN